MQIIAYTIKAENNVRCINCGALLAKNAQGKGSLEVKCGKCKEINKIILNER